MGKKFSPSTVQVKTFVTKPYLPPLEEFIPYLEDIWESKILTNGGKYHQILEDELCKHLGVKYISLFSNATIALMVALEALELKGSVITTPYSFVATTHSLLWKNIRPIFVDIDAKTTTLDPSKIADAIMSDTTGIMPVHCYGFSCETEKIKHIADKNNLKIIYDAAHAFGVQDKYGSILNHGDLSVLSFHATKVFNTFEGGAIISHTREMKSRIDQIKNFGFLNEETVSISGINGKMSEFNAAVGLLQLKYLDDIIQKRRTIYELYRNRLSNCKGIFLFPEQKNITKNFSYFPVLITDDFPISRDQLYEYLKTKEIYTRRYFWPLISSFPMYSHLESAHRQNLPIANKISEQILCLPIYPDLETEFVKYVCDSIISLKS